MSTFSCNMAMLIQVVVFLGSSFLFQLLLPLDLHNGIQRYCQTSFIDGKNARVLFETMNDIF